jgi:alkyl sulfatase BDS1-like metallo-beta-lactamase superfamily hydrolase
MKKLLLCLVGVFLAACPAPKAPVQERPTASLEAMERHCSEVIGEARVEQVAENVWVAIGYDLSNTILIRTEDGNVVIDPGMSPARAAVVREALLEKSAGPTRAIIYTHSHIDHVGGAKVWVDEHTEIWATDSFSEHILKQYGLFQKTESRRGQRQFGRNVSEEWLPCSALGRKVDIDAALESGLRMPTHTFSGSTELTFGGINIHLIEAHGETHDQLFVWLPAPKLLMPGDNFYEAFPNLYTIRGTSARPVNEWIRSLDAMRRLAPEILVPSHTRPIRGAAAIEEALRDYRDAIQWVRDEVVRRANAGERLETIVSAVGLPPHLAGKRHLAELYGQVDWSVRAIFSNELGWFDGDPEDLYPLDANLLASRELELMGGPGRVLAVARDSVEEDPRWALHLLAKLRHSGVLPADESLERLWVQTLRSLAAQTANTNGRGYLLQSALEVEGAAAVPPPRLDDELLKGIPLATFFNIMAVRLLPGETADVHEAVVFSFPETGERFVMTIRRGVAELVEGAALPGTPEPIAEVVLDPLTWRRLALRMENPAGALLSGRMRIVGSQAGFLRFIGRFEREL